MAYSRKQVVACVSIVYLIFTVALAGYPFARSTQLSLPIPSTLCGFTMALPIVSGVLLMVADHFTQRQERKKGLPKGTTVRPPLVIVANTLIFIYSAVVMTILGTHAGPSSALKSELEEQWKQMFSRKDVAGVRAIQNALNCCGFMNSHDRAWPFPDKSHDAHACEQAFNRTAGCLEPWRQEQQRLAGILITVVGLVFLWQVAVILILMRPESWRYQALANGENGEANGPGRGIDCPPNAVNYHAEPSVSEISDDEEGNAARDALGGYGRTG